MLQKNIDQQLKVAGEEIIKRLKELENSDAWIPNGEQPCLLFKMNVDGRVASKGIKICEFHIDKVVQFLKKEESLGKINPMLKQIKVIYLKQEENIHYKIHYMEYTGVWPVAGRDFVNVAIGFIESQNKVYIGTKAFDYPYPQNNKIVRGQIYLGAYIIQKIDQTHTKLTYISDVDLKGSIPTFFQNTLSTYQGLIAHRVADVISKEEKQKK